MVGGGDPRAASGACAAASQMRPWADAPTRLMGRPEVAVGCASAHAKQRAPEMRIEPRIAPGGGRGEHRQRSARGPEHLGCGVACAAAGRRSAAAGGSPCGCSRACCSVLDVARSLDADRAADLLRRRPR